MSARKVQLAGTFDMLSLQFQTLFVNQRTIGLNGTAATAKQFSSSASGLSQLHRWGQRGAPISAQFMRVSHIGVQHICGNGRQEGQHSGIRSGGCQALASHSCNTPGAASALSGINRALAPSSPFPCSLPALASPAPRLFSSSLASRPTLAPHSPPAPAHTNPTPTPQPHQPPLHQPPSATAAAASWSLPTDNGGWDADQDGSSGGGSSGMSKEEKEQHARELHSLNVAIGANILICMAKVWAHAISGSSAMLAEALHSVADILNQLLLRIGVLQAMRAPTQQHPYGYMRDRFVWALISAVGIFFLGSGASVIHGLHTLFETRVLEAEVWSYAVLGVSGLLEGYSLWVASRYVLAGARARGMPVLQYIKSGIDPTTVAVMMEDGGAVAGLAIAAACTALAHATGNAMWDAAGSIMVGGLLGLIATFLVQKNRDLLLGRSMSAKETQEVLGHLGRDPVVSYIRDAMSEEIGPRVYRFKAEVAWNSDALVDRYLQRCGRAALASRLREALAAESAATATTTAAAAAPQDQPTSTEQSQHPAAPAFQDGAMTIGLEAEAAAAARLGAGNGLGAAGGTTSAGSVGAAASNGASSAAGSPTLHHHHHHQQQPVADKPLDTVLKAYTRNIISAVGAEVDRIESELRALNPGIRWVDLETDRGRAVSWGPGGPGCVTATGVATPSESTPSGSTSDTTTTTPSSSSSAAAGLTVSAPLTASRGTSQLLSAGSSDPVVAGMQALQAVSQQEPSSPVHSQPCPGDSSAQSGGRNGQGDLDACYSCELPPAGSFSAPAASDTADKAAGRR